MNQDLSVPAPGIQCKCHLPGDALTAVIDRFIDEIWEDQKLDVLSEIVKEDATFYFGEDILTGVGAIREFIQTVHTAFPNLRYEIADLFIDGDKIAMRFIGTASHQGDYDGKAATGKMSVMRASQSFTWTGIGSPMVGLSRIGR